MRDLLDELRWVAERGSTSDVTASVVSRRRSPEWSAWTTAAVLGAIAVGAGALAVVHVRERSTPVEPVVFTIAAAENSVLVTPPEFAISPDGRQVVFLASASQGLAMLWVRPLATLAARALPGTERASQPFWSPDSRSVGFFADGKLKKVDVGGGSPTVLCDSASGLFGGTWSRNNIIVFAPSGGSPLLKVDAAGGMSKPMTTLDKDVISQRYPSFLSDGDHVIYLELRAAARELRVASLGSTDTTSIGAFIVARDRAGGFVDCSRKRRCGCEKARAAVGHQLQ